MAITLDGSTGITDANGGTVLNTTATQTLTNKSIAASQLTGALPAIDGSALTGIASMTLLGTLTTTSGIQHTLSGLTLTSYKMLIIAFSGVSCASTNRNLLFQGSYQISPAAPLAADTLGGILIATIESDTRTSGVSTLSIGGSTVASSYNGDSYNGFALLPSTTSLQFNFSGAGVFDAGQIKVYGVK